MRIHLITAMLLALGACASAPTPPVVAATSAAAPTAAPAASGAQVAQQTCRREPVTGTNRFETVCGSTSDEDRQASLDGLHKMAGTQGAGGGFSSGH